MKDEEDQADELSIGNSQSWSYIWKKLKYSVFDVLFVLLDNSQSQGSMFGLIFESGVDYLQMLSFPFNSVVVDVWNNNTLNGITNFFNNFNVSSYMPGIGFNTFLVLLYTLIFLIIVVICDIIYVAYSFSKKRFRFTFPLVFMAKIVPIIVTVMFLPIMQTLLNVVNCNTAQNQTYQVLQSFPDVVCWEGWHLFHTTITLIFSFMFVFISCIVALALFQPRMTTNNLTARQNSMGQVVFIINKIICQFIFSFSPFDGTMPYCLLLFILSCWLYYTYNVNQPYYNKNASKFFRICSTYYFWTNLMLLVSQILAETGFRDGLVIWICGIIFIGITIIFQRKSNIDTLFSSSLKFKSGLELESHLQYVLKLHHHRNQDKNSYMLLLGYIQKHIEICLEEDCPLRYNKMKFATGKQEEQYSCKQLLQQLQRMFVYGIKKYPECTKLRLTFAFFYLQKHQNSVKAYEHFNKSLLTQPSFGQQFIIYRFKKIISQKLEQQKQNNEQDLIELIRFDNHVSLCKQGMFISGKLHKQFWIQLREESPNLERLNFIGARIIQTRQMVLQNYKQVLKLSNDGPLIIQLQYNYALYLLFIAHETIIGNKLLQKVKRKIELRKRNESKNSKPEKQHKIQQLLNTKRGFLVGQLQFQQNGHDPCCRIRKVNSQLLDMTKYQQQDLIGKRLDKILPKMLQDCHDVKIKQWLENEQNEYKNQFQPHRLQIESGQQNVKSQYVGCQQIGYIKESTGFVRKVRYQVHFMHLQGKFISEIKNFTNETASCTLLCDSEGIINQICYFTIFKFPMARQLLQIQRLVGNGVIQKLHQSQTGFLSAQFQLQEPRSCKQFNSFQCLFEKLQVKYNCLNQNSKIIQHPLEQTYKLTKGSSQNKLIGIIVTISELRKSLGGISMKSDFGRSVKFCSKRSNEPTVVQQTKRTNMLPNITLAIDNFFNENSSDNQLNKSYKEQDKNNKNSFIQNAGLEVKKFDKFLNSQGIEATIKTFRYYRQEYQRVYNDGLMQQQSDYDYEQKIADLETKLSKEKMQDVEYQERVKKALNTQIYHPQVSILFFKTIFIYIMFLIFHLLFYNHNQEASIVQGIQRLNQSETNLRNLQILQKSISQTLFYQQLNNQTFSLLEGMKMNYRTGMDLPDPIVNGFLLEDNTAIDLDINNAFIRIQANLLRNSRLKLQQPQSNLNLVNQIGSVYQSYLTSISQCIQKTQQKILSVTHPAMGDQNYIVIMMAFFSLIFVIVWIKYSLTIKQKIFEILLWFLDIPLDYINFAQRQCMQFTKNYVQSQKTGEKKPIGQFVECEHYVQEYKSCINQRQSKQPHQNSSSQEGEDPKIQNFKTRQVLISRYRKMSLLSRFNIKQLFKILILVFLNIFLVFFLLIHEQIESQIKLINKSTSYYIMQQHFLQKIPIILKIANEKDKPLNNWDNFSSKQLDDMLTDSISKLQNFRKLVDQFQVELIQANTPFSLNLFYTLTTFESKDLCISQSTNLQCIVLIDGRLKGGYQILKSYVKNINKKLAGSQVDELERAVDEMMLDLIRMERDSIKKIQFTINISFYVYIILMSFFFIVPWNLYLKRLNVKLNQTIQILNVVPMILIPVHRKETRLFVKWIILKASKQYNHQQE